jgi:hypothetical protein
MKEFFEEYSGVLIYLVVFLTLFVYALKLLAYVIAR